MYAWTVIDAHPSHRGPHCPPTRDDQQIVTESGRYPTVGGLGEFGLIARIAARLGSGALGPVRLGPGDDAAALHLAGDVVASVDLLVEGRHFRRDWSSAHDVGIKAAASSLADVAAMGIPPTALLVGLALPPTTAVSWVDGLVDGMSEEASRAGAAIIGGDVSAADVVVVSMTALGDAGITAPVTRAGACPGDAIVVVGRLGWAAAGLAALESGLGDDPGLLPVVAAHRRPVVPYAAARDLARKGATAMIDVSDGLLADLGHVARSSAVTLEVQPSALPVGEPVRHAGSVLGADPLAWVLTGGDDHAIVATVPSAAVVGLGDTARVIGRVVEGPAVVTVDGMPSDTVSPGWRHFAGDSHL
jgi:thiamine-monophosphate kinase